MVDKKVAIRAAACVLAVWTVTRAQTPVGAPSGSVVIDGIEYPVMPVDRWRPYPLPPNLELHRVEVRRGNDNRVVAGEPFLVYSNTFSPIFAPSGVNVLLADDIETIAAGGCNLQQLDVVAFRPTTAGGTPGFTVTQWGIWDRCPDRPGATRILDLLEGTPLVVPENGAILLSTDLTGGEIPIPEVFWVGIAFNKSDVGWIGGDPAELGFSRNLVHVDTPSDLRCCAVFDGDLNLFGSMYAEVFCAPPVETTFVTYQASSDTRPPTFYGGDDCGPGGLGPCGDGINLDSTCEEAADDIHSLVGCALHGYSMSVVGASESGPSGPFQMEFELFTDDGSNPDGAGAPGEPIAGTRCCFDALGTGCMEWSNCFFDGSVILPERFWFVWSDDNANAGPFVAAGPSEIGASEDAYAVSTGGGNWEFFFFGEGCGDLENPCASFHIRITCVGEEPSGACCDAASATCREDVLGRACGAGNRFQAEVTCATASFNPPCGATACCMVDPQNSMETICDEMFPAECTAAGGEPFFGDFCSTVDCGRPSCLAATGDCLAGHGGRGCSNNDCCAMVCGVDPPCCDTAWDDICAGEARELCEEIPPENDDCRDAVPATLGVTAFSTLAATTDGPPLPSECISSNSVILGHDIWNSFMPPTNGNLTMDLCSDPNDYDTRIAVYEGCTCPPTVLVGCDDDGCEIPGRFVSRLMVPLTGGTCYLLRVGGWGADEVGMGEMSLEFVPASCPDGAVAFVNPPDGVVDARQPHPLNNASPRQGIQAIEVQAPSDLPDPLACFDHCETDDEGSPNSIFTIVENRGNSLYTINLMRTISVGAVTTISYGGPGGLTGVFASQPGNVNGVNGVNPADVLALRACLDGNLAMCPHGVFSWDIDGNGVRNPQDLARELDLLNGAMAFRSFNGDPQPSGTGCPQ